MSLTSHQSIEGAFATDATKIAAQRAGQSWRYAVVVSMIFVGMNGFFWLRGYQAGSIICSLHSCLMLVLMGFFRNRREPRHHRQFTNLFLSFSSATVFLLAIVHPGISVVLFLIPLAIVMSAQVLGLQGAVLWLVVSLAAFLSYGMCLEGLHIERSTALGDTVLLSCGVAERG